MIRICCVCRRREEEGQWRSEKVGRDQRVSHAYCPGCYEGLMEEIERYAIMKFNQSIYSNVYRKELQEA